MAGNLAHAIISKRRHLRLFYVLSQLVAVGCSGLHNIVKHVCQPVIETAIHREY